MWRERVRALTKAAFFKNPASTGILKDAEESLKMFFPAELRDLLLESDGIEGEYGLGLIWNCKRIVADNVQFRTNLDFPNLYMPFDSLLFFADAGNGDQFSFAIRNGQIQSSDVYIWNHENDSRTWTAPSLEKYLEWWLRGKIKI